MAREYGGYLPFETCEKDDWFSRYSGEDVLRTNSAKAAIYFAVKQSGAKKVLAPHYMCASVKNMLAQTGVETEYYFLDDALLPKLAGADPDTAVLLADYFGVLGARVRAAAERFPLVILDHSHAFFEEPVLRNGAYHIYSCRKFFGVPDGGYLVGRGVYRDLEPDLVSDRFSYLVTSFEQGTNAAYAEKQECDRSFLGNYKGMSRLSRGMLSSVDYELVRRRREENFEHLHGLLRPYNELSGLLPQTAPAYLYPFLVENGSKLKRRLVEEHIYVPALWRELVCPQYEGTLEYRLSEDTVFLPVDQRYTKRDMEYLAERVICLMRKSLI